MFGSKLHENTLSNWQQVCEWYQKQIAQMKIDHSELPFYSSYDIRDSNYKIAPIDANIYPAGFNNICPTDRENAPEIVKKYLTEMYGAGLKRILLVPEEHTQNPFYWENAFAIHDMIQAAGFQIKFGLARLDNNESAPFEIESLTGRKAIIPYADPDSAFWKEFQPQLIISNNDFSNAKEEWSKKISIPINPSRELGWYQRKKSTFFNHYNQLVKEFSTAANIDPFLMCVKTELFSDFDVEDESSRKRLAEKVDAFIASLKPEYEKRGIKQNPFVFVKNNSGTYGLAVVHIGSGQEILDLNYKTRKKLKAAKGGRSVEEVIIQEGIPSVVKSDGATAEPVIYMLGENLLGGFLRAHGEKNSEDSLNSPGAVYKKLCVSDLALDPKGCPMENVYGWAAKLACLAIGREAHEMKVTWPKLG